MPNIEPQNFTILAFSPNLLNESDQDSINRLYRESIEYDFPGGTQREYDYLVDQIELQRRDVSAGIGGPLQRKNQMLARPIAGVVFDKDKFVGYLTTAFNVSSSRRFPLNLLEMQAKMRMERFARNKWVTFGSRAFKPELLDGSSDLTQVSIVDVAGYLAIEERDDEHQVSSYPWEGEKLWASTLTSWGIEDTGESPIAVKPFGEKAISVAQHHYTTPESAFSPVLDVKIRMAGKEGASEAIDWAKAHEWGS